mgnify:FL=1
MSTLRVDKLQGQGDTSTYKFVVQTLQFTVAETSSIGAGSGTTLINSTFTPRLLNSKYAVWLHLPNCTATAGGSVVAKVNLGTSSTPNSNTEVIFAQERMEGTGADDVTSIHGHDFGTFTSTSTDTHYISLVVTPDHTLTVARHSNIGKLLLQEIAR